MNVSSRLFCVALCLWLITAVELQAQPRVVRLGVWRAYKPGDIVVIAADSAVQKELGFSESDAKKVKAVQESFVERVRERIPRGLRFGLGVTEDGRFRNVQQPVPETSQAFKDAIDQYLMDLKQVLTADQFNRLRQINWQVAGTAAFADADVIEALTITKEQQESIRAITEDYNTKRSETLPTGSGRFSGGLEAREKLVELNHEEDQKIKDTLTKVQLAQFATMTGTPFDVAHLTGPRGGIGETRLLRPQPSGGVAEALVLEDSRTMTVFDLIENAAVQKELKISADEAVQLKKLGREFRVASRQIIWNAPEEEPASSEASIKAFQKMAQADAAATEQLLPKLKAVLAADQFARLQQIHWQVSGAAVIAERAVAEALPLSKDQQDQIASILSEYEKQQLELFKNVAGYRSPALRPLNQKRDEKLNAVLTKEQAERLELLQGSKFDLGRTRGPFDGPRQMQRSDRDFDVSIAQPTYVDRRPKVLFDEAHRNFHRLNDKYSPFADLITNDGYQVIAGHDIFTADQLAKYDILVIANAPASAAASRSAFSDEECDVVHDWVKAGGSLLLITDHEPFGSGSRELAQRFGVNMSTRVTIDADNQAHRGLAFSRDKKLLGEHSIMTGRNNSEVINRVLTFTGQSLQGPPGSVALLKFSETASERDEAEIVSAAGRAQALALKYDKGRVVVTGEAGALTAQLFGWPPQPMGMNAPNCDNRQLAINIVHWLSGLLD